jgi:hypothetical protein
LGGAKVLEPVLGPHELDRTLDRDPVRSVPEHGHGTSTGAQMLELVRGPTCNKADACIPRDRGVEDARSDDRGVDRPVGPGRGDHGEGVLFGKVPDVI